MASFPNLPIEEEGRLGDPVLRENFVKRVLPAREWRDLVQAGLTQHSPTRFHSRFKYVLLAHEEARTRELGVWLAQQSGEVTELTRKSLPEYVYGHLATAATRKRHVNVLQHLQGFLKDEIDAQDKQELVEIIEQYRSEKLPLIVPVTLLRHHFRRHPKPFVENSAYLQPHPRN